MIKPAIGMPVLYFASEADHGLAMSVVHRTTPCHASIAYVHHADCINVHVIDHSGRPNARSCVRLLQGDRMPPADGTAYATFTAEALERAKELQDEYRPALTD